MNSKSKNGLISALEKNARFVIYRLPGENQARWMGQQDSPVKKVETLPSIDGFLFYPFSTNQNSPVFLSADYRGEFPGNAFNSFAKSCTAAKTQLYKLPVSINKTAYVNTLEQAVRDMKTKGIEKFIFSRVQKSNVLSSELMDCLLEKLQKKYPQALVYLFNHPATGLWIGATPEILLSKKGGKMITHSLAGTQPTNKGFDYHWGQKEIEEQGYVTRYIEDLMSDFKLKYRKTGSFTQEAGPVAHLKTKFDIDVSNDFPLWDFITKLHPTPAVCGLPKNKAREFIINTESHDRAYYTGFLGPISQNGNFDFFVNLRCMKVHREGISIFTGGGITKNSNPESEWEETQIKASTLTSILEDIRV